MSVSGQSREHLQIRMARAQNRLFPWLPFFLPVSKRKTLQCLHLDRYNQKSRLMAVQLSGV